MNTKLNTFAFASAIFTLTLLQGCNKETTQVQSAPAQVAEPDAASTNAMKNTPSGVSVEAKAHLNQAFSYLGSAKATSKGDARDKLLESAEIELDAALKENPLYLDALLNRGVVYMAQGKLNKAEADLVAVTKVDPKSAAAHYNLACVYALTKKIDLASDSLSLALQNGFSDLERLRKDSDLDNLRTTVNFQKILENNRIFI